MTKTSWIIRNSILVFLAAFMSFVLAPTPASAQTYQKHPRVAELEEKLTSDAFNYVRGRFPGLPVLVTARIDPLRRTTQTQTSEGLPYTPGSGSGEIQDEWDDPSKSLHELMPRIRNAQLNVTLPQTVTDQEVMEMREALFNVLNLIPARDKIDFERRNWVSEPPPDMRWLDIAVYAGGALLIVLALIFGMQGAATKVAAGLKGIQGSSPAPSVMPSMSSHAPVAAAGKQTSMAGDVRFNDPIKIKQQLKIAVESLSADPSFPTLEDMVHFDQKANEDPGLLGAVIAEFPQKVREKMFIYSYGKNWLEAFAEPGDLNLSAYEFVNRLARKDRQQSLPSWQDMLVAVWRLDDLIPEFLRTFGPDVGLLILAHMPTSVSIPMGKRAFPGAWGVLLGSEQKREMVDEKLAANIKASAVTLKPLNDLSLLETYRHEKGLLDFLKLAEPKDEQEVYEASRSDAVIHQIRPPFYPIFNASEEELRQLVPAFAIEEWALALFNVPRKDRRTIEGVMSEKQRYLLIETLKQLDQTQPDRLAVGTARETIGRSMGLKRTRDGLKNEIPLQADDDKGDSGAKTAA